ncbi:MAG TPA: hypothetical protein VE986_04770 [Hyphomicrobiales bacterium]|nr:hypothetical protein [Hyphomicrobiales bacterium]
MMDKAEIEGDTPEQGKRRGRFWTVTLSLLFGTAIGYTICSIQAWLFR